MRLEPLLLLTTLVKWTAQKGGFAHGAVCFDWSMPPRLGRDEDGDGLVDFVSLTAGAGANPELRVEFRCCREALQLGENVDSFRWTIDEVEVGLSPLVVHNSTTGQVVDDECSGYYVFEEQKEYNVELTVKTGSIQESYSSSVLPRDFLIIGFGDSYASGAGAPETPIVGTDVLHKMLNGHDTAVNDLFPSMNATRHAIKDLTSCDPSDLVKCARELLSSGIRDYQQSKSCRCAEQLGAAAESGIQTFDAAHKTFLDARDVVKHSGEAWRQYREDGAVWQPEPGGRQHCMRSSNSAQAIAARAIEDADDKSTVTFVHVACARAVARDFQEQLELAQKVVGPNREIDATMISMGGNDAQLLRVIVSCVAQESCFESSAYFNEKLESFIDTACGLGQALQPLFPKLPIDCRRNFMDYLHYDESAQEVFDRGLPELQKSLVGIKHALNESRFVRQNPSRVFLAEYESMFHSETGEVCSDGLLGVSEKEMGGIEDKMHDVHSIMRQESAASNWTYIDDMVEGSFTHGFCAKPVEQRYFVDLFESFLIQGNVLGFLHPNARGHQAMGDTLGDLLKTQLVPRGIPRRPQSQPKIINVQGTGPVVVGSPTEFLLTVFDADDDEFRLKWSVTGDACQIEQSTHTSNSPGRFTVTGLQAGRCTISLVASDEYSGDGSPFHLNITVVDDSPRQLRMGKGRHAS